MDRQMNIAYFESNTPPSISYSFDYFKCQTEVRLKRQILTKILTEGPVCISTQGQTNNCIDKTYGVSKVF